MDWNDVSALLARWREGPSGPWLGELIEQATERALADDPRKVKGTGTKRIGAWDKLLKRGDPLDVPALLDALLPMGVTYVPYRLGKLVDRGADPRVAAALVRWVLERPHGYQGRKSQPFWEAVLDGIVPMADPRAVAPLRELHDALASQDIARMHADVVLRERLPAVLEALEAIETVPAPDGARAQLAPEPAAPDIDLDALYDAVYADPDDDGPRWVLADALQAAGDPRGTFIALQLRASAPDGTLTRDERRRVSALKKDHGLAWLGPLASAVAKSSVKYARGFPVACTISRAPDAGSLADLRELGTLERLDLRHPGGIELWKRGHLGALREVSGRCTGLIAAERPLPLTSVSLGSWPHGATPAEVFASLAQHPHLAAVRLPLNPYWTPEQVREGLSAAGDALRQLTLVNLLGAEPAAWRTALDGVASRLERLQLQVDRQRSLTVEPGEDGVRLTIRWDVGCELDGGAAVSGGGMRDGSLDQLEAFLATDVVQPTDAVRLAPVLDGEPVTLPAERAHAVHTVLDGRCRSVEVIS